jgi:hypothetical protein
MAINGLFQQADEKTDTMTDDAQTEGCPLAARSGPDRRQ